MNAFGFFSVPRMDLLTANDRPGEYPATWYAAATPPLPRFPPLAGRHRADVCVIGGGYTGLSAALHLAEAGLDVRAARGEPGRLGRLGPQRRPARLRPAPRPGLARAPLRRRRRPRPLGHGRGGQGAGEGADRPPRHRLRPAAPASCTPPTAPAEVAALPRRGREARPRLRLRPSSSRSTAPASPATSPATPTTAASSTAAPRISTRSPTPSASRAPPPPPAPASTRRSRVTALGPPSHAPRSGRVRARFTHRRLQRLPRRARARGRRPGHADQQLHRRHRARSARTAPRADPATTSPSPTSRFVVNYFRLVRRRPPALRRRRELRLAFPGRHLRPRPPAHARRLPQLAGIPIDYAWGGTLAITTTRMPAFQRLGPTTFSAAGYSGHGIALATLAGKLMAEAVQGTAGRFDVFASLPPPRFPGGAALRRPLLVLAMSWYALRDRL